METKLSDLPTNTLRAIVLVEAMTGMPVLEAVLVLHLAEELLRSASRVDTSTPDFEYVVQMNGVKPK